MADRSREHGEQGESLTRGTSPAHTVVLPAVKMDLAVVVLVLVCLWFLVAAAGWPAAYEAAALLGGSMTACGWLVLRTRRVLARAQANARRGHGPE